MPKGAVHLGADALVQGRLDRLGAQFDVDWAGAVDADAGDTEPELVVVDAGDADALAEIAAARRRWPTSVIVAYLAAPDHDRWVAAQRAGADVVTNRGALAGKLRTLLAEPTGSLRRWFPLLPTADVAGRLGLVGRVETELIGSVAVYQVEGAVHVLSDRCPHAGAVLSEGELDNRVLTCPRHGSQFDVCTGERLRGPADSDVRTFPVRAADGQVSIDLAAAD